MKNIRKIMTWLLALTLVIGMFPLQGTKAEAAETTTVYERVDQITHGEEYLIVYNNEYALSVNGNSLTSTPVSLSNGEITLTADENNVLWTINNDSIQIDGKILELQGNPFNYSVGLGNGDSSKFTVSDEDSISASASFVGFRYLIYEGSSWSSSYFENNGFSFYQKTEPSQPDPGGDDYPEYPHEGSVRTTKTATAENFFENGIAKVELGVTGVPMKRGVDIVLVMDVSTSMDEIIGDRYNQREKMSVAKEAASNFINNYVFAPNTDGTSSNNRLALVTFAGYNDYYGEYEDGDGSGNKIVHQLSDYQNKESILSSINQLSTYSGTDYDYAFEAADKALDNADSSRETYVVFMTDGAPSKYNDYTHSRRNFKTNVNGNSLNAAESLKQNHPNTQIYTIGFDLSKGSEVVEGELAFTAEECRAILEKLATDSSFCIDATNDSALNEAFESVGASFRKAGTDATVTDIIGSSYTLQKTTDPDHEFDISPVIEVKRYVLDAQGNRTEDFTTIEKVTFFDDGLSATTEVNGEEPRVIQIEENGSFDATYFSYDVTGSGNNQKETFTWNIGDINESEITLSYYVYLKGSMEGLRGKGIYPTNESAVLNYTNYLGHDAHKDFDRPTMPWGEASITYEFYLVNENGEPVNSSGDVIPFNERVKVVSPRTKSFNWNSEEQITAEIEAQDLVPDGYTLHIPNAGFRVTAVSSGEGKTEIMGTQPETGISSTQGGSYDTQCSSTWVAFGVLNKTTLIPDSIVLDYGKKVKIDVMENDLLQNAVLDSVAKEDALDDSFDLEEDNTLVIEDGFGNTVGLENGNATVLEEEGMIEYEPTKYMDSIDHFLYSARITMDTEDGDTETQYKYQKVSVIPATSVYYEDNFGNTKDDDPSNGIVFTGNWEEENEGEIGNEYQDNGTVITDDHPYGNDSSYADNDKLSAGSAKVVTASGDENATASFTFRGTGFDLVSRTDNNSAVIAISVQNSNGEYVQRKMLDLEYSSGTLYQIPVHQARFNEYDEYTVTITVSTAGQDANFYLDAIRIYNPIDPNGEDAAEANERYQSDDEANAEITELRNILLDSESYDHGDANGILYVDGNDDGTDSYESVGPNNEVYLKPGNSIGFKLIVGANMETIQLGAKAPNGKVSMTVGSNDVATRTYTIGTATDMYYDITKTFVPYRTNSDGSEEGIIVITNTGEDDVILSLTNMKITYSDQRSSKYMIDDLSVEKIQKIAMARAEAMDEDSSQQPQEPTTPSKPNWQEKVEDIIDAAESFLDDLADQWQSFLDKIKERV